MRPGRLIKLLPRSFGAEGYLNRRGAIFLVSHMRGYTTLLSHQLGSHPEIAGYAEMHQNYRNALDFIGLAEKIEQAGAGLPRGRWLFDKILHPCRIADGVLQRDDLALLVSARPPRPTLTSILKGRHGGLDSERAAGDYYLARLSELRSLIERREGRVLFIEAEALIDSPAATLAGIAGYLGLSSGLSASYRSFPLTGRKKFGDSSIWIHSGRVESRRDGGGLLPPSRLLGELERAYGEFRDFALRRAADAICGEPPASFPSFPATAIAA